MAVPSRPGLGGGALALNLNALLAPLLQLLLFCSVPVTSAQAADSMIVGCSRTEYQRCVHMADPLLKDPRYIFPDNMADIDFVCGTWSQFVTCVKRYIDRCFTESRRLEFNKAVENPVDSVYQMCTVPQYQGEYLQYATCIKSTLTEDSHCGRHYRHLVEQVSGEVERISLCCSHHRFRECVLDQTARQCDSPRPGLATSGSAARFARQILDKALSFLRDQCSNFIPNASDCPGLGISSTGTYLPGRDAGSIESNAVNPRPPAVPAAPVSPWEPRPKGPGQGPGPSVQQGPGGSRRGKTPAPGPGDSSGAAASAAGSGPSAVSVGPSAGRSTDSVMSIGGGDASDKVQKQDWAVAKQNSPQQSAGGSGSAWLPGRVEAVPGRPAVTQSTVAQDGGSTLSAGSQLGQGHSARPASYGRGMTWPTSTAMGPTARSPAADWMPNSYNGISRISTTPASTDPWFPSTLAGSDSAVNSNAVDEPNQQGLAKNDWRRGSGSGRASWSAPLTILACLATAALGAVVT